MSEYINRLNPEIKEYFNILSKGEFPEFLLEYIDNPEMKRIGTIGLNCGTDYTNIFNNKYFYTRLDHSIGVALIIWNFTKNKTETLAGLFHDISTPCFSHCIDFLHKDYLSQESTEEGTKAVIQNSKEIMNLLKRDNINLEDVCDYKLYPIADNDTPKLSADRLEYTFSSGLSFTKRWNLIDIKEMYENLTVTKNEDGIDEISFKNKEVAEKFVSGASTMWKMFQSNEDKLVMQFLADIMKILIEKEIITEEDLYIYSEEEIIRKIENCGIKNVEEDFKNFKKTSKIGESDSLPQSNYYINFDVKKRYINPLVKDKRITNISEKSEKTIKEFLEYKTIQYCYFDFEIKSINLFDNEI